VTLPIVISSSKEERAPTKGKEASIAKWEEEIRKQIAAKKSGPATLTKQQQAAVNTQLAKEAKIRENVAQVKRNLERGLRLIQSVVAAGTGELRLYVSDLIKLLLNGPLRGGSFLVGDLAFETYLVSSKLVLPHIAFY
jgi:hypothetical protein